MMRKSIFCTLIFLGAHAYSMHTEAPYEPSNPRVVHDFSLLESRIVHYQVTSPDDIKAILGSENKIRAIRNHEIPIIKISTGSRNMYFYLSPTGICWAFGELVESENIPPYIRENIDTISSNKVTKITIPTARETFYVTHDNGNLASNDDGQLYVFKTYISKRNPTQTR